MTQNTDSLSQASKKADESRRTAVLRPAGMPAAQGMYDPSNEQDSCGIGFVANFHNKKSHKIVEDGLKILEKLEHRGAVGADPKAGDGAGILIQMPDTFFRTVTAELDFTLPAEGDYGVGFFFMPPDDATRARIEERLEAFVVAEGQEVLGWRDVPVDNSDLGYSVIPTEPVHRQLFVKRGTATADQDTFERKLFIIRKLIEITVMKEFGEDDFTRYFYVPSFSSRTICYKGMLLSTQVGNYYLDLQNPEMVSALALVHQRFSTNTFPTWSLAHPFRMICHNGEINTVRGNNNWMFARQGSMANELFGDDLEKVYPVIPEGQSDSACFDNALELMVASGYSMAHAMMMLVPEAWAGNPLMDAKRRAFYEYHAALMEPWDGPAAIAFTDGRQIGATLDRNGLRPARYYVTDDGTVMMASEMGVLPADESTIVQKWRLQPGKMLLIDLEEGRIIGDEEIKSELSASHPYEEWLSQTQIVLEDLPAVEKVGVDHSNASLLDMQQAFGYTQEDLKILMTPMAETGQEGIGSMGSDTPVAVLSNNSKTLYNYFQQNFAQVTNPPIDPIREEIVMSLVSFIGPRPNLLELEGTSDQKRLEVRQPILTNEDLEKIRHIGDIADNHFKTATLDITYDASAGAAGMKAALAALCVLAEEEVRQGDNIIILSDRKVSGDRIAIPALLATSAVHHYLIRKELRTSVGIIVETGEAREVHHFACLAGYGAEAINPYLAFETLEDMRAKGDLPGDLTDSEVCNRFIKAVNKGLLKVMSKMGISTYQSYCGAQIFDAVGLSKSFIEDYFTGTATKIEGISLKEVSNETVRTHALAFGSSPVLADNLEAGGDYAYRQRGEEHAWTPETIRDLQHAVRANNADDYQSFADTINEANERLLNVRGLFRIKTADEVGRKPVALEEVEPAENIVKRFATGAMSYGSISWEAHTTLAIAMNRIGGKSNTGEGGEEPRRFKPLPNGDTMRSAIKQVASGRFGVTTEYLVNSDMIQIKMAQGAKPGEGGQLPGHKVDAVIAKVRHSTQGVGLISPPPHHDIYSIEDLAQLIYDLKNTNPSSDISVKLVSEVGVGTVAAGVSKARADHLTISGFEGGTGASPLTSIKHAGAPWELGLAETHQTLVMNKLRDRIAVQADGGLRTGRDVVVAALLGADEVGFATAPLIAAGCLMMRKCHLNTCPVGIATQDPVLRKRFTGTPEHVINYFFFVAEEVRGYMAELGYKTFDEMVGQMDMLDKDRALKHWKSEGLDFAPMFTKPEAPEGVGIFHSKTQDHELEAVLDQTLIEKAKPALENGTPVSFEQEIININRSAGTMLSGEVARRFGHEGLPEDTIHIKLKGTAGQALGAWATRGVTLELEGEANDYVGKGLSGGRLIVYPPKEARQIVPEESIIVGNTVLYGAVEGECYFRGVGGERFAVRNSGAIAVVEGTGDHTCEYMTGGIVVVLGQTGRNFAAGMSGGIAYVLDEDGMFERRCNLSMVELEPIEAEDDAMIDRHHQRGDLESHGLVDVRSDLTRFDGERLRQLVENQARYTGSTRARAILDDWEGYLPKFRKVMPTEYRRALRELAEQKAAEDQIAAAGE